MRDMSGKVIYCASSELSAEEKIEGILTAMGGMSKFVRPGNVVLIKPNFVAPFPHATTSLDVLKAVVDAVKRCGGEPVIAESAGYEFDTETTFRVLGAYEFASEINVPLVNLDTAEYVRARLSRGWVRDVEIPKLVLDADVLINVPKLKRHSLTRVTVGAKNLIGLLHRRSRRRIHSFGLERAILELTKLIPTHLIIVDGTTVSERAVFGFQRSLNLLVGSDNVFAADHFCCRFLGVNPWDVRHIRLALQEGLLDEEGIALSERIGEPSGELPGLVKKECLSVRKVILRAGYQLMYLLEIPYAATMKGRSLIPAAHFYFGIRPWLDRTACNDCGTCVKACPVNAIKIPERKIDASKCMTIRCMQCVSACLRGAIRVRGRRVDAAISQLINGSVERLL
jgi:uncharacterized protein (DUF362 family)/ferredoxin